MERFEAPGVDAGEAVVVSVWKHVAQAETPESLQVRMRTLSVPAICFPYRGH